VVYPSADYQSAWVEVVPHCETSSRCIFQPTCRLSFRFCGTFIWVRSRPVAVSYLPFFNVRTFLSVVLRGCTLFDLFFMIWKKIWITSSEFFQNFLWNFLIKKVDFFKNFYIVTIAKLTSSRKYGFYVGFLWPNEGDWYFIVPLCRL
jgi:hypothetical protein